MTGTTHGVSHLSDLEDTLRYMLKDTAAAMCSDKGDAVADKGDEEVAQTSSFVHTVCPLCVASSAVKITSNLLLLAHPIVSIRTLTEYTIGRI